MQRLSMVDGWRLSAVYLLVIALLLIAAGISMRSSDVSRPRYGLSARPSDTISVKDVLTSIHSGKLRNCGVALLLLVGPAAEILKTSSALLITAVLLLGTAGALFRRHWIGALAGAAWAVVVLALSAVMLGRISVSYSFGARLLMFAPAAVLNLALLIALSGMLRRTPVSEMNRVQ